MLAEIGRACQYPGRCGRMCLAASRLPILQEADFGQQGEETGIVAQRLERRVGKNADKRTFVPLETDAEPENDVARAARYGMVPCDFESKRVTALIMDGLQLRHRIGHSLDACPVETRQAGRSHGTVARDLQPFPESGVVFQGEPVVAPGEVDQIEGMVGPGVTRIARDDLPQRSDARIRSARQEQCIGIERPRRAAVGVQLGRLARQRQRPPTR